MQGGPGIPHFYWYGEEGGYNILVIDLLGPSLERLFKQCKKFSLSTATAIADQMVNLRLVRGTDSEIGTLPQQVLSAS